VQDHASDKLHVEMSLAECAARCFAHLGKSLRREVIPAVSPPARRFFEFFLVFPLSASSESVFIPLREHYFRDNRLRLAEGGSILIAYPFLPKMPFLAILPQRA